MKHSRTWRGIAVAVAAVLGLGIAPTLATADESTSPDIQVFLDEASVYTADDLPIEGELLPEQDTATDVGESEGATTTEDATAEAVAPATMDAIAPQATAASLPTPDAVWEFFRIMNARRMDLGGAPWVMNPSLNAVSNTWLSQQTSTFPSKDPSVVSKVPGNWTEVYHTVGYAVATNPASAVSALKSELMSSNLRWGISTDIGIGMREATYYGAYKLYSFSIVAVDYPHTSAQTGEMTLYRFYKPSTGTHFYSTSASERNTVARNAGYRYEGQVAYVLKPNVSTTGTSNLNRFYQPSSGTHFYTSSVSEYNRVRTFPQYSLDGVAGKVYTRQVSGVTPMYRFYRPASGTHFYTASASEMASVKNMPGYTYEGVAFYLRKAS